jgi:NADPH:quinone reductase-like Zn-dependent oxidoreductase
VLVAGAVAGNDAVRPGPPRRGPTVLILGARSGVGAIAVQLAHEVGARVTIIQVAKGR